MGNYRELRVWHAAYRLTLEVYRITSGFPSAEKYGMVSQVRRAATSVTVNIAEGCGRSNDGDLRRFVQIARGSLQEVICELELSRDLGYLASTAVEPLLDDANEVGRMLTGLLRSEKARGGRFPPRPPALP